MSDTSLTAAAIQDIFAEAVARLRDAGIDGAERDARRLFAHRLSVEPHVITAPFDHPRLLARFDQSTEAVEALMADVAARAGGKPVSKIVGRRAFWKSEFRVTEDILDPRPETEVLVELALKEPFRHVLDLGTGSGCILVSLLMERRQATGVGTDISAAALAVAQRNAQDAQMSAAVRFVRSDWFEAIDGTFDLIVSNPPYIALSEMVGLQAEVRDYDPRIALTDEADGLTAYRAITAGAPSHLVPDGRLMVEIGPTQGNDVADMFRAAGLVDVAIHPDLDGRDRVVSGRAPADK